MKWKDFVKAVEMEMDNQGIDYEEANIADITIEREGLEAGVVSVEKFNNYNDLCIC